MNKEQIRRELEDAVDKADLSALDAALDKLDVLEGNTITPEDLMLFCARVKTQNKERESMNTTKRKPLRIAMVVAAVLLLSVSAYAAGALRLFHFASGDRFVTMRTTESMTQQEAQSLVEDNNAVNIEALDEANIIRDIPITEYTTREEAMKALDMQLPLPVAMEGLSLESASGQVLDLGGDHQQRTVWLNYSDQAGRMLGITVTRQIIPAGSQITAYTTHDMDEGSLGSYTSSNGVSYTTLTESDDSGELTAHIAFAQRGNYEYALVFLGYDEAERQAVLDSTDLTTLN